MGQSTDARKVWGGHFWIKVLRLEFEVPNFSVTSGEKKYGDILMRRKKLRQLVSHKESNVRTKMRWIQGTEGGREGGRNTLTCEVNT